MTSIVRFQFLSAHTNKMQIKKLNYPHQMFVYIMDPVYNINDDCL